MELTVPDYCIIAFTACGAVVGLFIGFSGALAFLAGLLASAVSGHLAWPVLQELLPNAMARGIAVLAGSLLVFGIVRWTIAKCVHGLIAQPGDSLLGALLAAATGLALSLCAIWLLRTFMPGDPAFSSAIFDMALAYARGY